MKFCWVTIMVENMENSIKFYEEILGLSINRRFAARPGVEICFMGQGETQVELICNEMQENPSQFNGISLGFVVESLDSMIDYIGEKGLKVFEGPIQPNPHIKFFYVKDPDGLKIQFVENIK